VNISYTDLGDSSNSNIINKIGSGVQGAVCGVYHNYKDWYHQNIDIGSPAGEILEGFWDKVCHNEGPYTPPPPPGPSFTGGQCACEIYIGNLQFKYTYYGTEYESAITGWQAQGPIQGFGSSIRPDGMTDLFVIGGSCVDGKVIGTQNFGYYLCVPQQHYVSAKFVSLYKKYGGADNCGNPPAPPSPPPPAPPDIINDNITIINNDGISVDIPISFNPQIFMPDLNINSKAFVFKPELNFSPQFNINQPPGGSSPPPPPSLNFDFGPDSVDVNIGPGSGSNNKFNNSVNFNNIIDIKDNLNDINVDIKKVTDSLDCDPCLQLKEIKDILTYKPTYTSASIPNFQSVTRDNLFNLGYLEIELSKLPHSTKIIFGGDSPNAMYTGWLFWRHNEFNFEKIIIHSAKSVYHAPKWANGFAICCSHGAKANVFYYTEVK
jgi:hypothetical protein